MLSAMSMPSRAVAPPALNPNDSLVIDAQHITPSMLVALARHRPRLSFAPAVLQRLDTDRAVVERHLASGAPVYGLNTGLGGNLGYRLTPQETLAYQRQIIQGRMIGMGEALPEDVVRAALLVRVLSVARGRTGVSPGAAQAVLNLLDRGITPVVPRWGSIGAGDLGLTAHLVAPILGLGEARYQDRVMTGQQALAAAGLEPATLLAKDGLGLINASPVTAGYAAVVLRELAQALLLSSAVSALTDEGYAANLSVFDPRIAQARPTGRQAEAAALFRCWLAGSSLGDGPPRSIQDAVSIRTVAQNFGATYAVVELLHRAVEDEINGCSDSPLVLADSNEMLSTPNFHMPLIAIAADAMAVAVTQLAAAAVQRIIKLQTPHLSGLPKYLSPVGGASVGFNAMQKTAAALYAEIRLKAAPAALDAFPVSDTVEDHATQAMLALRKLDEQQRVYRHLVALEALVAAQAVDLRQSRQLGAGSQWVHSTVRAVVPPLHEDRPNGPDAMSVHAALFAGPLYASLHTLAGDHPQVASLSHLL